MAPNDSHLLLTTRTYPRRLLNQPFVPSSESFCALNFDFADPKLRGRRKVSTELLVPDGGGLSGAPPVPDIDGGAEGGDEGDSEDEDEDGRSDGKVRVDGVGFWWHAVLFEDEGGPRASQLHSSTLFESSDYSFREISLRYLRGPTFRRIATRILTNGEITMYPRWADLSLVEGGRGPLEGRYL